MSDDIARARERWVCLGEDVTRRFYGDGVHFAAGWWAHCAECGAVVKLRSDGIFEWADVHLRPEELPR